MRRTTRALVHLLGALTVGACGLGMLDETVPGDAAEWEPLLVGTWTDSTGREQAVIGGDSASQYTLAYIDEDSLVGEFTARLGRLGPWRILDLKPAEPDLDASPLYESLLVGLYHPIVIERVTETELVFRGLDQDSLKAFLRRAPSATSHFVRGEDLILTGQTPELRRFLGEYLRRPGVLSETAGWVRRGR